SPHWQIEALRRLEIPEDMQKKYGFKPLGPADGPVKSAILGETNARLYKYERRAALATDRITAMKDEYARSGAARSNLRYGYVMPARGVGDKTTRRWRRATESLRGPVADPIPRPPAPGARRSSRHGLGA